MEAHLEDDACPLAVELSTSGGGKTKRSNKRRKKKNDLLARKGDAAAGEPFADLTIVEEAPVVSRNSAHVTQLWRGIFEKSIDS